MEDFNELNEDDVDLTTYFEEITCCSEDINHTYNNPEPVTLREGNSFNTFDDAELHVRRFAEYKGFKVRLGRVKMVDTAESSKVVHKRTILCKHSGS